MVKIPRPFLSSLLILDLVDQRSLVFVAVVSNSSTIPILSALQEHIVFIEYFTKQCLPWVLRLFERTNQAWIRGVRLLWLLASLSTIAHDSLFLGLSGVRAMPWNGSRSGLSPMIGGSSCPLINLSNLGLGSSGFEGFGSGFGEPCFLPVLKIDPFHGHYRTQSRMTCSQLLIRTCSWPPIPPTSNAKTSPIRNHSARRSHDTFVSIWGTFSSYARRIVAVNCRFVNSVGSKRYSCKTAGSNPALLKSRKRYA